MKRVIARVKSAVVHWRLETKILLYWPDEVVYVLQSICLYSWILTRTSSCICGALVTVGACVEALIRSDRRGRERKRRDPRAGIDGAEAQIRNCAASVDCDGA